PMRYIGILLDLLLPPGLQRHFRHLVQVGDHGFDPPRHSLHWVCHLQAWLQRILQLACHLSSSWDRCCHLHSDWAVHKHSTLVLALTVPVKWTVGVSHAVPNASSTHVLNCKPYLAWSYLL